MAAPDQMSRLSHVLPIICSTHTRKLYLLQNHALPMTKYSLVTIDGEPDRELIIAEKCALLCNFFAGFFMQCTITVIIWFEPSLWNRDRLINCYTGSQISHQVPHTFEKWLWNHVRSRGKILLVKPNHLISIFVMCDRRQTTMHALAILLQFQYNDL